MDPDSDTISVYLIPIHDIISDTRAAVDHQAKHDMGLGHMWKFHSYLLTYLPTTQITG